MMEGVNLLLRKHRKKDILRYYPDPVAQCLGFTPQHVNTKVCNKTVPI